MAAHVAALNAHAPASERHAPHGADGEMLRALVLQDRVFASLLDEMVRWLGVGPGTRVLDAGCGAGGMAVALARAGATVEALDPGEQQRLATRIAADEAGVGHLVTVRDGDVTGLPYSDASFDLVWCSRVLHHVRDMRAGANELARVVQGGGRVAIREGGFTFRVLPDDIGICEPHLEDRLAASGVGRFARPRDLEGAEPYPFGWPQLLIDVGLGELQARTFATDSLAPLSDDEREWVLRNWRRWLEGDEMRQRLSPADLGVLERLADPESPDWAFRRSDLHLRTGHAVYVATKLGTDGEVHPYASPQHPHASAGEPQTNIDQHCEAT